jgi:protein-S-isoprenylcysteine O-methyltransferase Ste14
VSVERRIPPNLETARTLDQGATKASVAERAARQWRWLPPLSGRRFGDVLLFSVTAVELAILALLTPTFTFVDWIYLSQHLIVLGLAFTRRAPATQDYSLVSSIAVVVAYAYPYAQIAYLGWKPGEPVSQTAGLVLVTVAALLSLASLVSLGRSFGIRPALRGLVTYGPYRVVRHPIYVAYVVSDVGYNLQEWNVGSLLLVLAGWTSLLYRIHAEERVLSRDHRWPAYVASVPYRLFPGLW